MPGGDRGARCYPSRCAAGRLSPVLLSDRDILAEIDAGRIALEPWEPAMLQP